MEIIETVDLARWDKVVSGDIRERAIHALESGRVIHLPTLSFTLDTREQTLLSPAILKGNRKNASFDFKTGKVSGTTLPPDQNNTLGLMMRRYAISAMTLIENLFPRYQAHYRVSRTSFRPAEIEGRISSYRKDDTRLHVDAFPSQPNQGKRLLRVFTNINPHGEARVWRVGEPFENVARRFLPKSRSPFVGSQRTLHFLKITKSKRSLYDHLMLQMHNRMKGDLYYQQHVSQSIISFEPNTSWIVFTDQVSHAAMSGQHVLEQTFMLPVHALQNEGTAPIKVLEKLTQKVLQD